MLVTFLPWSFPKWEAVPGWSSQMYKEERVGKGVGVSAPGTLVPCGPISYQHERTHWQSTFLEDLD